LKPLVLEMCPAVPPEYEELSEEYRQALAEREKIARSKSREELLSGPDEAKQKLKAVCYSQGASRTFREVWVVTDDRNVLLKANEVRSCQSIEALAEDLEEIHPAPEGFTRVVLVKNMVVITRPLCRNGATEDACFDMVAKEKEILLRDSSIGGTSYRYYDRGAVRVRKGIVLRAVTTDQMRLPPDRSWLGEHLYRLCFERNIEKKMVRKEVAKAKRRVNRGLVRVDTLHTFIHHLIRVVIGHRLTRGLFTWHCIDYDLIRRSPQRINSIRTMFRLLEVMEALYKRQKPYRRTTDFEEKRKLSKSYEQLLIECAPLISRTLGKDPAKSVKVEDKQLMRWILKEMKATGGRKRWSNIHEKRKDAEIKKAYATAGSRM
jgi:hypothetical protein